MRIKTALVAVLALAFQAQGAPVSPSEAASAVRGWAASGERLGVNFRDRIDISSGAVETTAVHTASSGATFYAVRLRGCGTVFMSGDTEIEPVIAFTESAADYSTRNGSPFWILLDGDISTRRPADGASEKWSRYWAADPERPRRLKAAGPRTDEPSDLRVAPLVQSKWGQTTNALGEATWNYYTPTNTTPGSSDNYPCGCVATMTAQIMRYLHGPVGDGALEGGLGIPFPLEHVEAKTVKCQVDGKGKNLKMQGGTYAWENMPLTADGIDDKQRQNIGKLTSDVGIASEMSYSDESGTSLYNATEALKNTFGYKQAYHISVLTEDGAYQPGSVYIGLSWDEETLHGAIFANLDAKRPCMLGISSSGVAGTGHAIVADGYGFEGEGEARVPYVHLNMGWSGECDVWYNLPNMHNDYYDFNVIDDLGYNIFPDIGGDADVGGGASVTHAIMSGRVLAWESGSGDPMPVEGATVKVFRTGESDLVTNVITDAKGVWAAIIPAGKYDVEAQSSDGKGFGITNGVHVSAPWYNIYSRRAGVGNSWGNDIVLGDPIVVAGNDTEYEPFGTIDRAVDGARKLYDKDTGDPVFVKVVAAGAALTADAVIDFKCVVSVTNDDPRAWAVARQNGAKFVVLGTNEMSSVTNSLVMSNIVFAAEKGADTLVDVKAGGSLSICGTVDFGVGHLNAAVKTADASGFRLLGAIDKDCGFTLDCATATNEQGDVVGYCVASTAEDFAALTNSAPHIANFRDENGEVRASLRNVVAGDEHPKGFNFKLVWVRQPVPFEDAVAYYVDKNNATNTAGRIDVMIDSYLDAMANGDVSGDCVMGLRKDDTLSRPVTVGAGRSLTIVGESVEVSAEPTAGFSVTGGKLSVSGVSFSDYVGNALFLVNGDDAELSVSNVAFSAIEGTNAWSGAMAIVKGSASVEDATFENCQATGKFSKNKNPVQTKGGAIYVADNESLTLRNCLITGCSSKPSNSGGGVFAGKGAVVTLAGNVEVFGNTSGEGNAKKADDMHLANSANSRATLSLADSVTGKVGVFWEKSGTGGFGNTNGCFLAEAAGGAVATNSANAFFCNAVGQDVVAEAFDDSGSWKLRWADAPVGPQPLPYDPSAGTPPEGALACVVGEDGATTNFYESVAYALTVAKDGETVRVVQRTPVDEYDDTTVPLDSDVVVSANVTIASYYEGACSIWRTNDYTVAVVAGASLTVTNIEFHQSFGVVATKPLFDVAGGTLTLDDGAEISGISGDGSRNAGAVSVWKGGTFVMKTGAMIWDCVNKYESPSDGCGRGAGVLVDDGIAVLEGGEIYYCEAYTGGGVFIGNKGSIEISGDTKITGNTTLDGKTKSNLVVYDNGRLVLAGALSESAKIGYTEGASADARAFASVADGVSDEDAAASARKFRHDITGDFGMAVTKGDVRLLVWSAALDDDGRFVENPDDEESDVYELIPGSSVEIEVPQKVEGLVYDGKSKVGVAASSGFTVTGNIATNAGDHYIATASLRPGYVWADGTSNATNIEWSIAKATYDMSGVTFGDKTFQYDGKWHAVEIEGDLPKGVTVKYENHRRRVVGTNEFATAHIIAGDPSNYETMDGINVTNMTAKLIIEPMPDPVWPVGLSFGNPKSKTVAAAGQSQQVPDSAGSDDWVIAGVAEREGQWFSLYETDSLSGGFNIENMEPVERKQAVMEDGVPVIRFTRQKTDSASRYWRIVAEP